MESLVLDNLSLADGSLILSVADNLSVARLSLSLSLTLSLPPS